LVVVTAVVAGIGVLVISRGRTVFAIIWMMVAFGAISYNALAMYQRARSAARRARSTADEALSARHDRLAALGDADQREPASKGSTVAAAIAPLPAAVFFWFIVLVLPQNPVVLGATFFSAGGLTAFLWDRGDTATDGWERVYPKGASLASQFFHPFDPRKIDYAAQRASMAARPLLIVWYVSRGLLIFAWLFGLTRALLFSDGS